MLNNLPSKYQQNFISKMKRFFLRMFSNNNRFQTREGTNANQKLNNSTLQDSIFVKMKEESKKNHLKEEIFFIIDNNPSLLETLSIEQLEEVNSMYDKIIEENNKKINKLKRTLA